MLLIISVHKLSRQSALFFIDIPRLHNLPLLVD
jgi:hypothetical protein